MSQREKLDPIKLLNNQQQCSIGNGYFIAYLSDQVLVGRWENNSPALEEKMSGWENLLQLHIFNEQEEIRFIKSQSKGWLIRYLSDQGADNHESNWYDEHLLIIGNPTNQSPARKKQERKGFVTCSEAGRSIKLPEEALGKRLWVRNYLEDVAFEDGEAEIASVQHADAENGQEINGFPPLNSLRVKDYRFVGFSNGEDAQDRQGGNPA
ncbi:MAG: CRISPR-associated protein Csx19 [Christensenellales bacterium]|jgi:CRISPR-associated protein (TIGR03984 family)